MLNYILQDEMAPIEPVPVPVLSQRVSFQEQKEKKIAIIENEFGEANNAISFQNDLVCVMSHVVG